MSLEFYMHQLFSNTNDIINWRQMHLKTDYHVLVLDTYILTSHFLILAELIFFLFEL